MTDHPHFRECSECMNRGGGVLLPGAGRVITDAPEPEKLLPVSRTRGYRAGVYVTKREAIT